MATPNLQRVGYSSLTYNAAACRYVDTKTKRFLSPERVRAIVDEDIAARAERMQRLAQRVASGEINPTEFAIALRRETKAAHLVNMAAAKGGFHQLGQADYGRVGGLLRYHFGRVDVFAADIRNGRYGDPPDVKQIEQRAQLFSEAARNTYAVVRHDEMVKAKFTHKSNRLDDGALHCTGPNSCPAMTALGRVEITDSRYLMEGSRACGPRCRCETEYWKSPA